MRKVQTHILKAVASWMLLQLLLLVLHIRLQHYKIYLAYLSFYDCLFCCCTIVII
jgi:hypothetical protein